MEPTPKRRNAGDHEAQDEKKEKEVESERQLTAWNGSP